MEFMLDTVNLEDIKRWAKILPVAGVTSNPSIVKKEGKINFFERIQEIREVIGPSASIHIQVVAKDYEGILRDARKIQQESGKDTYVKIPVTTEGLAAMKVLKEEGIRITATAIYTTFQGLLAIEAGADYLAPYYNRMENLNIDPEEVLCQLAQAIATTGSSSKILAASFKNVAQVNRAFACGAQAITAGCDVFEAAFAMPAINRAVDDFAKDWQDAQGQLHI